MGNRKFSLSEMIPNAWFYKLKQMGTRNHLPPKKNPVPPPQSPLPLSTTATNGPETEHAFSQPRKSYYFTRELNTKTPNLDPPRKSSKKRRPTTTATTKKRQTSLPTPSSTPTTTTKCSSSSSSVSAGDETCVVIDVDNVSLGRLKTEDSVSGRLKTEDSVSRVVLAPIKTERKKFNGLGKKIGGAQEAIDEPIKQKKSSVKCRDTGGNEYLSVKVDREESMASSVFKEQGNRPVRRFPTGSPRVRVRINSPRLARRVQINSSKASVSSSLSRKNISSDSLAVVKSSFDPQRDFRESMVEMIVENNIRASKDLEELLACYLSLNSDEYHDVIILVFKQIWFEVNNIKRVREVVV